MPKYPVIFQQTADDIISDAYETIDLLIKGYGIRTEDWPLMKDESPAIWFRIEQLELLGPQTLNETRRSCEALAKNYERMFQRHIEARLNQRAA